ncbi:MAG: type I-G CRISPR-associated protein Cas7 [Planctomycetota bacterium]
MAEFSFGGVTVPEGTKRLYVTAELVSSSDDPRIQPTKFPDIDTVMYPDPSGEHAQICLIESEPSMANRLEEACVADKYTGDLRTELDGLPYVKVMRGDRFMTASTIDAHRFASPHILGASTTEPNGNFGKDTMLVDYLKSELGVDAGDTKGKNVPAANVPRIFRLAMELDPMSLIHGFQISSEKLSFVGLRSPRALVASIVGLNAQLVGIPGIKFDPLVTGKAAEGHQPIFRKERIVARTIQANFAIDVRLLSGLAVGPKAVGEENDKQKSHRESEGHHRRNLLLAIALWKVARFLKDLSDGHRLRTECDLVLDSAKYTTKYKKDWKEDSPPHFPVDQIVADGQKKDGDNPAEGSLQDLITESGLPGSRSPLTLELGD